MIKGKKVYIPDPPKTPKEVAILPKECSKTVEEASVKPSSQQLLIRTPLGKGVGA